LQRFVREVEAQKFVEHEKVQKLKGWNYCKVEGVTCRVVEISWRTSLQHFAIESGPSLALPSSSKWEERTLFIEEIGETIRCVENIEESARPMFERLLRGIFRRSVKVVMGPGAMGHKPMEI
jgi:hypothetical protein